MIAVMVPVPSGARPCALQQTRQFGKDGGRIAARDRRLAGGGRDFADRMGETRDAVDDQKHVVALVAIVLGNGDRGQRRHLAQHRAFIACGNHGNRFGQVFAERVLDEFAHFTAAFADQRDDDLVEGIGTRQHRQQRGLADAGTGENAETLAEAERREDVDGAHAGAESHAARAGVSSMVAPYWKSDGGYRLAGEVRGRRSARQAH